MLPLVANIPPTLAQPPFHENFFKNFQDGQTEIESKVDVKCSVIALFECLQYAHQKKLVENALEIVFNVVKKSLVKDSSDGGFAMSEIAKPFFDMMTKWVKHEDHKRAYEKIYSGNFFFRWAQTFCKPCALTISGIVMRFFPTKERRNREKKCTGTIFEFRHVVS